MDAARRTLAAVYRRALDVSLARIWENVLDWEHLPWLHRSSFVGIDEVEALSDGWRARVLLPPAEAPLPARIAVELDRDRLRYVTRTLDGPGAGAEIWTRLAPEDERRTRIEVEFRLADVGPEGGEKARAVGAAYVQLYTRLWNEDEGMMARRQAVLDARPARAAGAGVIALGPVEALRARLPADVAAGGARFRIVEVDGALRAHTTLCPHLGGPLDEAGVDAGGRLVCPWHGYAFDVRTGRSCDGRRLALAPGAEVRVDASGEASLAWGGA